MGAETHLRDGAVEAVEVRVGLIARELLADLGGTHALTRAVAEGIAVRVLREKAGKLKVGGLF